MADESDISWDYSNCSPYLGIRLTTYDGSEYPSDVNGEKLVLIDTGYDGEICIPLWLYTELGFERWEEPEPKQYQSRGGDIFMRVAHGCIRIPKYSSEPIPVSVEAQEDEVTDNEIIIGAGFVKRFRLLLDGPARKLYLL